MKLTGRDLREFTPLLNTVESAYTNNAPAISKTSQRTTSAHEKTESWKNLCPLLIMTSGSKPKPSECKAHCFVAFSSWTGKEGEGWDGLLPGSLSPWRVAEGRKVGHSIIWWLGCGPRGSEDLERVTRVSKHSLRLHERAFFESS